MSNAEAKNIISASSVNIVKESVWRSWGEGEITNGFHLLLARKTTHTPGFMGSACSWIHGLNTF